MHETVCVGIGFSKRTMYTPHSLNEWVTPPALSTPHKLVVSLVRKRRHQPFPNYVSRKYLYEFIYYPNIYLNLLYNSVI